MSPPTTWSWHDALTPLSRSSRRRWAIGCALLLALLAIAIVDDAYALGSDGREGIPVSVATGACLLLGVLRTSTRRLTAFHHPELDERDVDSRNSAYRIAFPLLALVVLAGLVLLSAGSADPGASWPLVNLGLWVALWAVFLPTGVLAWREPDALEGEMGGEFLSEPIRDGLLGLALAGAVAADLLDLGPALVLVVASLAALGLLARRAAGRGGSVRA